MATKLSDVHTNITTNASGSQIVFHNPAQHPLPVGAGVPVVAATKTVGNPNGSVHGQVPNTTIVHNNPA